MENCLLSRSSLPTLTWDEKHTKALLRLHRYPLRLIQVEPWQSWIESRGGVEHVLNRLCNTPLPYDQEKIFNIILANPYASAWIYYNKLNISPSSYFFRLKNLIRTLLLRLNTWNVEQPNALSKPTITTNLPSILTQLIGAEKSLANAVAILRQPSTRLLTLTGPGGVGKTRLAIAVGTAMLENFESGVFFVPLETINDPALLVTQIARSLNMETIGIEPLLEALKSYLSERQILLILDNFEQLIQAGPTVTDLLQTAGNIKVLVTSREPLNLYGEVCFTVPELIGPSPDKLPSLEQLSQWPALDLFVQRLQARHPEFIVDEISLATIVGICQRLDGLPLAIELAVAQVRLLQPDQPFPQLDFGLKTLVNFSRDRPVRQRTLWDTIDWSYQLLPESEKAVFRRVAVFGREWSLEAAQTVCQVDNLLANLEELVDKNLLRYVGQGEDGNSRFHMLQPIREYAFDRLASCAETEQVQGRHAVYFLEMVERAEQVIGTPEQIRWVRRIKQERENLQIAVQWMLDKEETEMAFKLLGAAWRYYNMLNIWDETKSWMERALTQGAHLKNKAHVKTLWGASWLATHYDDVTHQMALAQQGLVLARELDNQLLIGLLLQNVGDGFRQRREYDRAMSLLDESLRLFRRMDNKEEIAWVLFHIADVVWDRGEHAKSMEIRHESLAIFRAIGDQWSVASVLLRIGLLALKDGDNKLAAKDLTECLEIFRVIGAKQIISGTLYFLAMLAQQQGDFEQAKVMIEESHAISQEIGDKRGVGRILNFKGRLALQQSDTAAARGLFEKAQSIFQQVGDQKALADNFEYLKHLRLTEKGQ